MRKRPSAVGDLRLWLRMTALPGGYAVAAELHASLARQRVDLHSA